MHLKYLTFSIAAAFISWIAGMIITEILKRSGQYHKLANLNYITSEKANKYLGLDAFKWVVKNTFFKYFNPKLTLKNKVELQRLEELRAEMTFSEISHLTAFCSVCVLALLKIIKGEFIFAAVITAVNILMNLYPSLLQQQNKRRIDKFLNKLKLRGI
ncbi:hypothetical protein ACLI09_13865 [Flavobacterium sp. RHBU_24]|uniref:glycosyl-4,4'-diaponeurosporenoate acyltransferase CrtO family protein n=1 Tax=Flavobacterium sp. RHBU_24 TaxID=3391185 RepID=UPI0039854040